MKFQRETAVGVYDEMLPLLQKHWEEIAHFKDIPLSPDKEKYFKFESLNLLRVFTVRDTEDKLLGYAVFFLTYNPHYKESLQANQDVIFILKEHRGFGKQFIQWCDEQLKNEGVQLTYQHVKKAHNFGPMLERMGYELVDLIYARRL